jgi:hypothetical protein
MQTSNVAAILEQRGGAGDMQMYRYWKVLHRAQVLPMLSSDVDKGEQIYATATAAVDAAEQLVNFIIPAGRNLFPDIDVVYTLALYDAAETACDGVYRNVHQLLSIALGRSSTSGGTQDSTGTTSSGMIE